MRKDDLLGAFPLQIHGPESIHYTTISSEAYSKWFRSVEAVIASHLSFQKPKELSISSSVMALAKALKGILSQKRRIKCHILLAEILDKDADYHSYDDVSEAVCLALSEREAYLPWCITIAVARNNINIFRDAAFVKLRLIPLCENRGVGLILLSDDENVRPITLSQGRLPIVTELPSLKLSWNERKQDEKAKTLTTEEIEADLQILFGHFEVEVNGKAFHLPAITSVKKLARNGTFIKQLRTDTVRILRSSHFTVVTCGIPGSGINELALAVVEGDTQKIYDYRKLPPSNSNSILILCDLLCELYPLQDTILELSGRNMRNIVVVGIARYRNSPRLTDVKSLSYVETNYETVPASDLRKCNFCRQNGEPIKGDHFEIFAREIKHFDPITFWEFIRQNSDFYKVGHWPSKRTPNHYLFTIVTAPIFKRHGFGLALRLRNIIESNKTIHGSWIKKIVCTEGEESTELSIALSEVLGLQQQDVIRIPRRFFPSIAGKQIDPDLQKYIEREYGEDVLNRRNVLIVDQAAHHFKTMSSLRDICEYYDCTVVGFAVFIDRTDTALSLGEYLYDSNYFALYSWPVPPRRGHECPCKKEL